jgi:putative membrane protein
MTLNIRLVSLLSAGAVIAFSGSALAQQGPSMGGSMGSGMNGSMNGQPGMSGRSQTSGGTSSLSSSDRQFLTQSAQDSLLEFASSQLAVQKAQNPQLVQYAMRLLNDHTEYNQRLLMLARQKGLVLPVTLDQQQRSKLAQLERLSGAAFDREYTREADQANTQDVNQLQRQSQSTQDQDVQTFISEVLPTQQQHQQLAQALGGQTGQNAQ